MQNSKIILEDMLACVEEAKEHLSVLNGAIHTISKRGNELELMIRSIGGLLNHFVSDVHEIAKEDGVIISPMFDIKEE